MAQSLKELKEENAKAEEEAANTPQVVEEEIEEEAVEVETEELEEVAEPVEGEEEETETEDWMQSDEQTSPDADKKFTDSDVAAAKRKLRAKLEKKDDELSVLRAEVEKLKGGPAPAQVASAKPTRDAFYDAEDQDAAYIEALTDWKLENVQAEQRSTNANAEVTRQHEEFKRVTDKAVDQHYERAVDLADKSGISAELYQSSDMRVRQMIESVFPQAGDVITDAMIASLGEGSERVFYNLGVNKSRLGELKSRLVQDNTGVKAAMYLGQLNAELAAPQKRKTNARKPATIVKGDAQSSAKLKASEKKYAEAHKVGDTSKAFRIKREAKKAGIDTTTW